MRPSGLAVAPKVASAPRGPRFGSLAGNPVQSLPQAASIRTPISVSVRSKVQRIKLYLQTVEIPNHFHDGLRVGDVALCCQEASRRSGNIAYTLL
jgi:hypothetical protein